MPEKRDNIPEIGVSERAYRQKQELRAKKRRKRRLRKAAVLGALGLGAVLLVACFVLLVRALFLPAGPGVSTASAASPGASGAASRPVAANPGSWNLLLVNAQNPLPANHIADDDLALIAGSPNYFDARAVSHLDRMMADCNAVEGHDLRLLAGYRSAEVQNTKHQEKVAEFTQNGAEDPTAEAARYEPDADHSELRTGLAAQFITGRMQYLSEGFAETPEGKWLLENCATYGFILRYPQEKQAITGMAYQPYHFRYVGFDDAMRIQPAGICLEEYLAL